METWIASITEHNLISILLICILVGSALQGMLRGGSRSAGRLLSLLGGGILTVLGLVASIPFTMWMSPVVQEWLSTHVVLPDRKLGTWEQMYFTLATAVRDFPLMRFAVLFLLSYIVLRFLLGTILAFIFGIGKSGGSLFGGERSGSVLGRLIGLIIGTVIGAARGLVVIAVLFIAVTLFPTSSFSRYVEASPVYQQGAIHVIEPLSGGLIREKLPVFTRSVEAELNGILQRKYEVIDANIPQNIEQMAFELMKDAHTDEQKARILYDWVGSRIVYDNDKVSDYENKGIWHEQTPEMTFDTGRGVCIDYSRLYAAMARSQGLKVKVVTGLGYDGRGGYGPHAWNEVYISEKDKWIPLDATWASSGDWFNSSGFHETHIADKVI